MAKRRDFVGTRELRYSRKKVYKSLPLEDRTVLIQKMI